jgi:hypothetical protein
MVEFKCQSENKFGKKHVRKLMKSDLQKHKNVKTITESLEEMKRTEENEIQGYRDRQNSEKLLFVGILK